MYSKRLIVYLLEQWYILSTKVTEMHLFIQELALLTQLEILRYVCITETK